MIINNKKELNSTIYRKKTLSILEAGIKAVLPVKLIEDKVRYSSKIFTINGKDYYFKKRAFVIGGGKASGAMAEKLEKMLGKDIADGIVVCQKSNFKTKRLKVMETGHPVPDKRGLKAMKRMLALKEKYSIGKGDIIFCLISGGGSSLMGSPIEGVSLKDKQKVNGLLIKSGADIKEINSVRKHLSRVKGGSLGHFFSPAKVVSLIISDVGSNDLGSIASGPTFPDRSTFSDALLILKKYKLTPKVPKKVLGVLKRGAKGEIKETPKKLDNCFNHIIGDNKTALKAMKKKAKELKLKPLIITSKQSGKPFELASSLSKNIANNKYAKYDTLLIGGEMNPFVSSKKGKGGRNQHLALTFLFLMKDYKRKWVLASLASDGVDFINEASGAIVDNNSFRLAIRKGLDIDKYIKNYNSYNFFKKIGGSIIRTDYTNTNVSDLIVCLI